MVLPINDVDNKMYRNNLNDDIIIVVRFRCDK